MTEAFLQYVWRHQMLQGREFTSTDGRALRIVRPGELNRDAGPDFFTHKQTDKLKARTRYLERY